MGDRPVDGQASQGGRKRIDGVGQPVDHDVGDGTGSASADCGTHQIIGSGGIELGEPRGAVLEVVGECQLADHRSEVDLLRALVEEVDDLGRLGLHFGGGVDDHRVAARIRDDTGGSDRR